MPIRIVIPDGSMQKVVLNLFSKAGLPVSVEERRGKGHVAVDWISEVALLRPQEIPGYLEAGHFDVAIVGQDWLADWGLGFPVLVELPIGRSGDKPVTIVLAVDKDSNIDRAEDLPDGCEVATEYTRLTRRFFDRMGRPKIRVVLSYGKTELKVGFGATAIVDVVETGESLAANHLKVIHTLMQSSTVVVANPASYADRVKRPYITCFCKLIEGAYRASLYVEMFANVPKAVVAEASQIMKGMKGPTISPLTTKGWYALHALVEKSREHKVIFDLLQIRVTGIVVVRDIPLVMT